MKKTIIIPLCVALLFGGYLIMLNLNQNTEEPSYTGKLDDETEIAKPSSSEVAKKLDINEFIDVKKKKFLQEILKNKDFVIEKNHNLHLNEASLDKEKLAVIKKKLENGITLVKSGKKIKKNFSVVEAFNYLNISVSMVCIPEKYAQDDSAFYFSGGVNANPVNDFSSGIAVSKKDALIKAW